MTKLFAVILKVCRENNKSVMLGAEKELFNVP